MSHIDLDLSCGVYLFGGVFLSVLVVLKGGLDCVVREVDDFCVFSERPAFYGVVGGCPGCNFLQFFEEVEPVAEHLWWEWGRCPKVFRFGVVVLWSSD